MKHLIILILFVSALFSNINKDTNSLFTQEELEWIKKNPVVKIGVDANWPPFEYVNEKR
jgi:two-component system, NarL family, sensor histidine kinase EvgS